MSTIIRAGLALRVEPSASTSERYLWRCVVPSVEAKYGDLCLERHSHTYRLKAMRDHFLVLACPAIQSARDAEQKI